VVDQSYDGTVNLSAAINDCCNYVAQTFTAGRDGLLAGVNIDTEVAQGPEVPLRVSIRNLEGGVPGETLLATTLLPSANVPFSQLVTFPQTVRIRAGVKYSIVVNLEDPLPLSQGTWVGGEPNPYPGGEYCSKYNPGISTETWFCYLGEDNPDGDLHFRTYLTPLAPTTTDECKTGGWRQFGFKNQNRCVWFVVSTRICDALERHGIHLRFCPPTPPNLLRPN
jgi:hypothetical protein